MNYDATADMEILLPCFCSAQSGAYPDHDPSCPAFYRREVAKRLEVLNELRDRLEVLEAKTDQ